MVLPIVLTSQTKGLLVVCWNVLLNLIMFESFFLNVHAVYFKHQISVLNCLVCMDADRHHKAVYAFVLVVKCWIQRIIELAFVNFDLILILSLLKSCKFMFDSRFERVRNVGRMWSNLCELEQLVSLWVQSQLHNDARWTLQTSNKYLVQFF